ncbi:sensor histidine kinase [Jannaschia sp. M317]|uniref:sensor histidine kinase n=1 Tax=Jannaschia sp. M317 TaxID=2867011 RepID=UPI0021A4C37D|nr:sensor histidine kinase [Jannaschia sp. M317]UWQ18868.1 sensor histidine kinase [Jannaschia sp. M317]
MTLFDWSQYMPHGMCLLWEPWLVALWVGSDLLIVLSYFAIPLALLLFLRQRPDLRYRGLVALFAGFILLCGVTHVLSIVTLWLPVYPLAGTIKLATGLVSGATALVLFRLVPTLVRIPSPAQMEAANARLLAEITSHQATLSDLRAAQADLEKRVAARTEELARANDRLSVAAREAVHRSSNMLTVVAAMARQSARGAERIEDFLTAFTGRVDALAKATARVMRGDDRGAADLEAVMRDQLEPVLMTWADRVRIEGPALNIGAEGAQQICLALHELSTNAQKYGAFAHPDGRLSLTWRVENDAEAGPMLAVTWAETLGRPMGPETGQGFGTRLVTQIVPQTLQGRAERRFEDDRLIYDLRVPMAAIGPRDDLTQAQDRPDGPEPQPA